MSGRYIRPEVGDNNIVYKGRRYWVIQMTGQDSIEGFSKNDCDYLIYDGLFGAIMALIEKQEDGKIKGTLMSHVELSYLFNSLEDAIKKLPVYADDYYKSV